MYESGTSLAQLPKRDSWEGALYLGETGYLHGVLPVMPWNVFALQGLEFVTSTSHRCGLGGQSEQ